MEVPPQKSAPGSALSPARVLGGIQRPRHFPGFGLGSDGFLGSPERAASSSPVTTLTQTMHNLAGLGSETPKTQKGSLTFQNRLAGLSLSRRTSESSLSSESSDSSDAGLCMDSPSPVDPQTAEHAFEQAIQAASRVIQNEQFTIKRFRSLPVRLLEHSPVLQNISNSQALDSRKENEAGYRAANSPGEDKENVRFRRPVWKSSRERMYLTPERKMEVEESSSSLTPVERASEEDDGFVDILESDLKVSSLGLQGPSMHPTWIVQKRRALTPARLQPTPVSEELEGTEYQPDIGQSEKTRWAGATEEWRLGVMKVLPAEGKPGAGGSLLLFRFWGRELP